MRQSIAPLSCFSLSIKTCQFMCGVRSHLSHTRARCFGDTVKARDKYYTGAMTEDHWTTSAGKVLSIGVGVVRNVVAAAAGLYIALFLPSRAVCRTGGGQREGLTRA